MLLVRVVVLLFFVATVVAGMCAIAVAIVNVVAVVSLLCLVVGCRLCSCNCGCGCRGVVALIAVICCALLL